MGLNKEIKILGHRIEMKPRTKEDMKGMNIGEKLLYRFYDGTYKDVPMLFVEPKNGNPTPKECDITAKRLTDLYGLPTVFILEPGPTYERQRLADKGVYFVMSERYAHLPMLFALEKTSDRKKATMLTPVAQYLLLYHLQADSIEGLSAREIAALIPYSYESTTLGITCLADVGLCKKVKKGQRCRVIHFESKGEKLWESAQNFLQSPVRQRVYCDNILTDKEYPVCGINSLAHYTQLNPDAERMIMMTSEEYRSMKDTGLFENLNVFDGNIIIEIWKYPAIGLTKNSPQWVDRLSLALSLKGDNDARVGKEVESLINETIWKD